MPSCIGVAQLSREADEAAEPGGGGGNWGGNSGADGEWTTSIGTLVGRTHLASVLINFPL